jgi:ABC-2 type transport system permease protein
MEWSVRRELWENRSVYIAPLAVAAVMLFAFSISAIGLPRRWRALLLLDPAQQQAAIEKPYNVAAMMILLTAFVVGVFYCIDALHGERRDRSILFWKSLPVSDLTTVLSKASIPLLILPLLSFAIIAATQLIMLLLSSAVLLGSGLSAEALSTQLKFIPSPVALLGAVLATALWHAPIYGWLLMVSAWAKRAAMLWAVLPFVAINVFEKMAFHTSHLTALHGYRLFGSFPQALVREGRGRIMIKPLTQLTPAEFLSRPGLWIGLAFAAAFLAVAVRLRRDREPI